MDFATLHFFREELEKQAASRGLVRKYLSPAEAKKIHSLAIKGERWGRDLHQALSSRGVSPTHQKKLVNHFIGKEVGATRAVVAKNVPKTHKAMVVPRATSEGRQPGIWVGKRGGKGPGEQILDTSPVPLPSRLVERATDASFALKTTRR